MKMKDGKFVNAEEFVTIWQTSGSMEEVLERTGLKRISASVRASRLRKRGVPLKIFGTRGQPRLDLDALAALAKKLETKPATSPTVRKAAKA